MGEICIHYGSLEDSVKKSRQARNEISGYIDEIKRRVITPIANLPGNDAMGYTSSAASLAWQKINSLNEKSGRFSAYETRLNNLISVAKARDNTVSRRMETIASMYVEKRNWLQNVGDWIYNTFCVDLANRWDFTRDFMDAAKWIADKIGNGLEKVVDWIKYGDGKYVWNIATAVLGTVVAIGGAIAAICAIPFDCGATLPIAIACIGAAAASIGAIITAVNSVTSVVQNSNAISKSGDLFDNSDGDPSAARHYGSQTTLSSYFNKNDMGDKTTNERYKTAGEVVDTTKTVADITAVVCSIASLGIARDYRVTTRSNVNTRINEGKWNEGFSFTYDNIKRNIMHDMGYKISSGELPLKDGFNANKGIFAKSWTVEKKFTLRWDGGSWSVPEGLVKLFRGAKVTKNVLDIGKDTSTLYDYFEYRNTGPSWEDTGEAVESVTGLLGNMDFYSVFDKYGTKPGKSIGDIIELFAN